MAGWYCQKEFRSPQRAVTYLSERLALADIQTLRLTLDLFNKNNINFKRKKNLKQGEHQSREKILMKILWALLPPSPLPDGRKADAQD